MSTKALLLAAGVANVVVAFRFELPSDIPAPTAIVGPSTTDTTFNGPITPGPFLPWSNTSSPWANTTLSNSSDPHCFDCPGYGYPYASSCSQASQTWSSASQAWWTNHYTVSHSILPSLTKYTSFIPSPRHRNQLAGCVKVSPFFIFSNVRNITEIRPEFSGPAGAPVVALGYPVAQPSCTINRVDCSSLWDVHDAQPTAQPVPTCNDYALHLPCLAPYILPTDYSLYIPSITWALPTTASPPFVPINPSDLPGGLFAPIPQHSTATTSQQQQQQQQQPPAQKQPTQQQPTQQQPTQQHPAQQQPTQQPSPQQSRPLAVQQPATPPHADPITTTTLVNNVPLTATIFPPQTLPGTTIGPSIVIAGTTLLPSSPPVTVAGAALSAALPSGALVSITSTTITPAFSPLAASTPDPNPAGASPLEQPVAVAHFTVDGHAWTVTSSGSAIIFGSGMTASVGGPAITLSGAAMLPSPLASSAGAASADTFGNGQDVEVVSAAPGGGIVVIHESTVIAMPTSTDGAPSATQAPGQDTFSTSSVVSGADADAGPLASTASSASGSALSSLASPATAASASGQAPDTITTLIKGGSSEAQVPGLSGAQAAGSPLGTGASELGEQGAAACLATPTSWTLYAAAGMLAVVHLVLVL